MCTTQEVCKATRDAWQAHPEVTDALELFAIGFERARANNTDAFLTSAQLSETILFHAEAESVARRKGSSHGNLRS